MPKVRITAQFRKNREREKDMYFSVIVPIYGVEKYIRECVDSILCQNFCDFELILVD